MKSKNLYDDSESIDPVTNNLRRIYREKGFTKQKDMALFLGEKPDVFKHYIWAAKRQIPSYRKLKRWAAILEIEVLEFFHLSPKEPWPYCPPKEKKIRKPGLGYRMAVQIREEVIEALPLDYILSHEGLRYLYNMNANVHKATTYQYNDESTGMVAESISSETGGIS